MHHSPLGADRFAPEGKSVRPIKPIGSEIAFHNHTRLNQFINRGPDLFCRQIGELFIKG